MKPTVATYNIWERTPMANRNIDYTKLLKNVDEMIGLLEYDSMRSAGKCKMNSQHLHSLYFLKDKYESNMEAPKPSIKPAEVPKPTTKKVTKKVASKAAE